MNAIYKRNLEGEEILAVTDEMMQLDPENRNPKFQQVSVFSKVLDDDTPAIADAFVAWKKEVPLLW